MIKTTERGWPGHFMLGSRCVFTRNTLVESGDTRIVVSTVGLLRERGPDGEIKIAEVGHNRFFETKAFHAYRNVVGGDEQRKRWYWDNDSTREISLDTDWMIERSDADDLANEMHERAVDEIKRRIRSGEFGDEWPEFAEEVSP